MILFPVIFYTESFLLFITNFYRWKFCFLLDFIFQFSLFIIYLLFIVLYFVYVSYCLFYFFLSFLFVFFNRSRRSSTDVTTVNRTADRIPFVRYFLCYHFILIYSIIYFLILFFNFNPFLFLTSAMKSQGENLRLLLDKNLINNGIIFIFSFNLCSNFDIFKKHDNYNL